MPEAVQISISGGATASADAKHFARAEVTRLRESFQREHGYDPDDVMQHMASPGFSFKKVRESIRKQVLREAIAESMFAYLTRYGVQKILMDQYDLVETIYDDIALTNPSKGFEEWYAPLHRYDIPLPVERGEPAPEGRINGLSVAIRNQRYARAFVIERELIEDDQTGQIVRRAQEMGDGMKYAEELACLNAFFTAGTNAAVTSGQTPFSNVAGASGNATAASALTQPALEAAWTALTLILDLEGNFMLVKPDALVVGTQDQITAEKLMTSTFQPSFPTGTAGSTGYFNTKNVLEGKFTIYASAFVQKIRVANSGAGYPWALTQKKRSLVFQPRTPVTVEQEARNSSVSLLQYEDRYVLQRRFGTGMVDGRFTIWMN
ncbi:MAG: hypothetical protein NVSMB19_25360 [Vulcanimicrobiaceae bacterium]